MDANPAKDNKNTYQRSKAYIPPEHEWVCVGDTRWSFLNAAISKVIACLQEQITTEKNK